ncbi:hypothetical protein TEA_018876 [Camellia sinensis var. sinensis]|uniref:O-fucosyltransferase family protein n=1 Tax=Camellia sinensis var. sinensis TaxID=542762 RepID=A0A4S4E713_CAMSN|nr:hypothetical protein TEA_018876 [Camellia sinensis var. sinensis]
MAIHKAPRSNKKPRSPVFILTISISAIALLYLLSSLNSTNGFSFSSAKTLKNLVVKTHQRPFNASEKYLYWGNRIDCPGKNCETCAGLGHQESSLRCALEEAMFLQRIQCPENLRVPPQGSSTEGESGPKIRPKGVVDGQQVNIPVLPLVGPEGRRRLDPQIKVLLGDYDAIHVRRGDILKTRKDRLGVDRSVHPHVDRDTRPEFILCRISKWVPPGRTLYIASNERTPGFFSPLSVRYKLAYSSNYSSILDPLIENNYQLFMIERLIMMGAKTFIRTFKEDDTDLSLTDDPKKNTKTWQIPVYTMDGEGC